MSFADGEEEEEEEDEDDDDDDFDENDLGEDTHLMAVLAANRAKREKEEQERKAQLREQYLAKKRAEQEIVDKYVCFMSIHWVFDATFFDQNGNPEKSIIITRAD